MEDKNNKRSRSSNWSESEKALLTALIKEKIHLIENKDVSKNNNNMKKAAWQDILQSFNQINETRRDLAQLINQWRNTKNNIKKRDFEYRRSCNATGGGPRPPSPPPEDMEIMAILPQEFEIDQNIYDSDSFNSKKEYVPKDDIDQPSCSGIKHIPSLPLQSTEIDIKNGDQPACTLNYSSSLQLQPIEIVTTPTSSKPVKGKGDYLKNIKVNKRKITPNASEQEIFLLAKSAREKQIKFQEVEHKRRMEIMEEEHKMRLKIMKKEFEFWEKKVAD